MKGVHVHAQPNTGEYDSNYWLCTITIDENVKIKGQENAYKTIVTGAVGGAAGAIHAASSAVTDCLRERRFRSHLQGRHVSARQTVCERRGCEVYR